MFVGYKKNEKGYAAIATQDCVNEDAIWKLAQTILGGTVLMVYRKFYGNMTVWYFAQD